VKVLVTGHAGYIGSVLVAALAGAGHRVTGLDTFYYEGCDLVDPRLDVPALRRDVRDVEPDDLRGHDAVVHLAGLSNDPLGDLNPELTREINFDATVRIARAAREAGVPRFIFASSCSMYGANADGSAVDETAPQKPLTVYAESKVRSEKALTELADANFSPVYMRNATVYGVSPRLRTDLVLNNLVAWAFTTGKVRILSDGTPWRPLVHVEDVARATIALLEAPRDVVHNEAFNVGQERENYQVKDLGEIVAETVPGCEIAYAGAGDPDPRSYRVSFRKLHAALPDLRLRWDARAGARELFDAYRTRPLTLVEFEGDRYTRLRRLQRLLDAGAIDERLRVRAAPEYATAAAAT